MVRVSSRLRLLYAILLASVIAQSGFSYTVLRRARKASDKAHEVYASATALVAACNALVDASSSSALSGSSDAPEGPSAGRYEPIPPRLRVTGRSGSFRWAEFEFPDGHAARYYLPTNAPPARVRVWMHGIISDALLHQPRVEATGDGPEAEGA